jgi:hypothetical protein
VVVEEEGELEEEALSREVLASATSEEAEEEEAEEEEAKEAEEAEEEVEAEAEKDTGRIWLMLTTVCISNPSFSLSPFSFVSLLLLLLFS